MKRLLALTLSALVPMSVAFAEQEPVSQLNELLRGELSAVETYRQALEKVGTEPGAADLRANLANHKDAVSKLTTEITKLGGQPSTDSGAWGTWAKTVVGSAKVIGDEAALKALKEGEEHGIKEYREALENTKVSANVKDLINKTFIPRQENHIAKIDKMMDQQG